MSLVYNLTEVSRAHFWSCLKSTLMKRLCVVSCDDRNMDEVKKKTIDLFTPQPYASLLKTKSQSVSKTKLFIILKEIDRQSERERERVQCYAYDKLFGSNA